MVLTPMLVRAEYAADGNFQNGTTFNAIHRNFPIPSYTTQVVNGWREIHTDDLVMRYKENSGLFSPTNFTVQLQGQAQPCTFAQGCEAEGAALSGGAVLARDHQNYTGTGFVTGYAHAGAATSWAVGGIPTAESAILAIRYANAIAGNGQAIARTLSLYVNGSKTGQITFPTTTNWDTWGMVQQAIHLKSGMDTVALVCDPGDSCNVNLDSIAVTHSSGSYPTEQPTLVIPDWGQAAAFPCTFAQGCEAENASLSGGEGVRSDHQHYTGTGFVADYGVQGATTTWTLHDVPASANDTLTIRYANAIAGNGQAIARTLSLYVNGSKTGQITFPTTANWDTWSTVQQTVQLHAGDTTIALGCDSGDSCNVNIDSLTTQEICALGQICQAEQAALSHGASVSSNHQSFTGKGFVTGYEQTGATARWTVHSVPQDGDAILTIRYANFLGSDNQTTSRTLNLSINGGQASTVTFAPTMSWDSWESVTQTIHLTAGENTIALSCGSGNSCHVNLDSLAITSPDSALPLMTPSNLGGWERSLDLQSDASALNNGLLSHDGWYLIDDSQTALWDTRNWPTARPSHNGTYQDGYFFGYGHHYTTALSDLAQLTGASPLLPRWAFGNWYSRYYAYKDTDYEQTLLPKFRSEQVPLDALVVDTDWKSPSQWNGWNWNASLFPDPQGFLHWAQGQGLHVTLNTHASMQDDDPQFATANRTAGGLIPNGNNNYIWDWSNQAQATSYMNLHHPFDQQGVRFWWLDWCCDASRVSMPGLNPDGWVNYLYASDATKQGLRGFAFSRMGSAYTGYTNDSYMVPSGPWSNHRTTLQFTGDTQPTWQMLSFESAFTQKEGNIGQAYVTHDIGSFAGKHLSDDLYVRWVQLGTFQPILRLHSDHGDRLPWDYDDTARIPAEQFMRLREALIPYLYTLSWQTYSDGLPMTRGLYLTYPEDPEAYTFDREYMLGDQMLVAPITSAGTTASTQVWLPPGTWTDYFTGKTYTGPSIQTITDDLTKMPVFIRAGGILPIQPYMDDSTQKSVDPLTLNVYTGADGTFSLYEDNGEGLDYQHNKYALTPISYSQRQSTIQIEAAQGRYAQQLTQRSYLVNIINVATTPSSVTVNGQVLSQTSSGTGWTYDANAQTVHVAVNQRSTQSALTIKLNS
jgi:alpha-glucosidase (family GH31 glycosyl hydrolase)